MTEGFETHVPRAAIKLYCGRSHPRLGEDVARALAIPLGDIELATFANGELYVRFEKSVRGADVFVIQTGGADVNTDIMELLVIIDALKRASAERITAIVPHYPYARQDKKTLPREPITAKLVADLLTVSGVNRLVTMDLHAGQVQGYFDCPVDHLTALTVLLDYLKERHEAQMSEWVVVSPDVGRVKTAKRAADILGAGLAVLHKSRSGRNVVEVTEVVGDVAGKTVLIVDDMIDTGGTITSGAEALLKAGSDAVYVAATHGLLSGPAKDRLQNAGLKEVVVTDTVPIPEEKRFDGLTVLSIAELLARTVRNIHEDLSVSGLFADLDHA